MHLCLNIYFAYMQSEIVGSFFLDVFPQKLLEVMNEFIETPWRCSSDTSAVMGNSALISSDTLTWTTQMVVNDRR